MPKLRHTVKDSVFSYIFRDPANRRQLYLALHPEDKDITEKDCQLITLENILTVGIVNDLGILVRDTLIILIEAQSTYTVNITLRILMYLAKTYKEYIEKHRYNLYSTTPVTIPRPELYMVYVGDPHKMPDELRLSMLYGGGAGDVELTVHVLKDSGEKNIVDQYIRFCEICREQLKLHGPEKAAAEILRICKEENILMPFLLTREQEVRDIMITLFDQEYATRMMQEEAHQKGMQEGVQKGMQRGMQQGMQKGMQKGRQEGIQEGMQKGILNSLRSLVAATGWPLEQAMATLSIPEAERPAYRKILQQ